MITGFKWKKKDIKQAITEPKFGKIFIKRFLIWLGVFAIAALIVFQRAGDYVVELRTRTLNYARTHIAEVVKDLYETDPESEDYSCKVSSLKASLAYYQRMGKYYAEVQIGDKKYATDADTACTSLFMGDRDYYENYIIEDISYLDPVFEAAEIDKESIIENASDRFDLLVEIANGLTDINMDFKLMPRTMYINRETHTFIPGVVVFEAHGKQYIVDCTPANTEGYKFEDYGDDYWIHDITECYRADPDLSSKDVTEFDVFNGSMCYSVSAEEFNNLEQEYAWYIGYSPMKEYSLFELAPVTSIAIPVAALLMALAAALIHSFVKYQGEKTVWKIFEYRTKTTEAMAHDLKTPLAAIMAYAENLEEHSEDPAKVREYSKNINEKVSAMDRMIADILTLSKGETCRIEVNTEDVSVMELVKLSLMEFPDMKYDLKGLDARLKTDKKLLKQTVDNLLSNCDRYGDKESPVDITVSPEKLVIINKTDMVYSDAESLKKPFVKGEDSRGAKGTGLGLAIAENNLNILGFKLELESGSGFFKAIVKFK